MNVFPLRSFKEKQLRIENKLSLERGAYETKCWNFMSDLLFT